MWNPQYSQKGVGHRQSDKLTINNIYEIHNIDTSVYIQNLV